MIGPTIVDVGPIVALVLHRDLHHDWAEALFDQIRPPLLTCEAVVTEACFLVRSAHGGRRAVLDLVAKGTIVIDFRLGDEVSAVAALMDRYANVPMSLADACLDAHGGAARRGARPDAGRRLPRLSDARPGARAGDLAGGLRPRRREGAIRRAPAESR